MLETLFKLEALLGVLTGVTFSFLGLAIDAGVDIASIPVDAMYREFRGERPERY